MTNLWTKICLVVVVLCLVAQVLFAAEPTNSLESSLNRARKNRNQIQKALDAVPASQREGMEFLVANMPERDLESLSADFLLDNVRLAYEAWNNSVWKNNIPKEIFLADLLPYMNVTEHRDNWRGDFYKWFKPLVKDAKTPSEAAIILNQNIFSWLGVHYSSKRDRADQSPYQSIKSGTASCTGLAILLIDACRAVGVPARFVGTPLWADGSGNHSWVEIWDSGWHFTGADEPTGNRLDQAWFVERASLAEQGHPLHAIYAVSYKRTPQTFPLVWDRTADYVFAVNVTDRYKGQSESLSHGVVPVMFRTLDRPDGERVAADMKIIDADGKVVFSGNTKDEHFDTNDHLTVRLSLGQEFRIKIYWYGRDSVEKIKVEKSDSLFTIVLDASAEKRVEKNVKTSSADVE